MTLKRCERCGKDFLSSGWKGMLCHVCTVDDWRAAEKKNELRC